MLLPMAEEQGSVAEAFDADGPFGGGWEWVAAAADEADDAGGAGGWGVGPGTVKLLLIRTVP